MKIKGEKQIIILVMAAVVMLLGGCSRHRKTLVYNTAESIEEEKTYADEDAAAVQEEAARKEMTFTKNEWIDSMKEKGYTEEVTKYDETELIAFERNGCSIETGVPKSENEKCKSFNIYIDKEDYNSAIASNDVRKVYLDFVRCLIELQGDTYDEEVVWGFITNSEKLDGDSYYLSDGIEAYSQIYMNQITIIVIPR